MSARSNTHARWLAHVNGVNPPHAMRHWLVDRTSLTLKLVAHSTAFRVQRIRQGLGMILSDEYTEIGMPRRARVREREVVLRCDERPVVYAHTIVPLAATASDWPFFNTLGERSLGSTLFGDPAVKRGELQYARLHSRHPLVQRACDAIGVKPIACPLYARRCLYRRKNGALLVTEVFLPTIADLVPAAPDSLNASQQNKRSAGQKRSGEALT